MLVTISTNAVVPCLVTRLDCLSSGLPNCCFVSL